MAELPPNEETADERPAPLLPITNATSADASALCEAVQKALYTLPSKFETELSISGILATDVFTFNTAFAATIENQVVEALNQMRKDWDPDDKFAAYHFVRRPQQFPDVILRTEVPNAKPKILMGIELKSWYVLAKEKEPSFRFDVTPAVCCPEDLLVVYPWALENVISGSPRLYDPFVIKAREAAEFRNNYWRNTIRPEDPEALAISTETACYPVKSDRINDVPSNDRGHNFGRIARTGLMDEYKKQMFSERLSGIPIDCWVSFFKLFAENEPEERIAANLDRRVKQVLKRKFPDPLAEIEQIRVELQALVERLTT